MDTVWHQALSHPWVFLGLMLCILSGCTTPVQSATVTETEFPTTVTTYVPECTLNSFSLNEEKRKETILVFDWDLNGRVEDCSDIKICVQPDGSCVNLTASEPGEVNITGLTPGTAYTATITANEKPGGLNNQNLSDVGNTVPAPPSSVIPTVVGSNQINLTIEEPNPGSVSHYNVTYKWKDGTSDISTLYVAPNTTIPVTHLKPGETYIFTVYSWSNEEPSLRNTSSTGTTELIAADATVTSVTEHNITVSWTSLNATYNHVNINCMGSNGANSATVDVKIPITSGTCVGLTPGALYNINVTTVLDSGVTPPVSQVISTDTITEPLPPESITIKTVNTLSLNVTIGYSYNNVTGQCSEFKIVYQGNGTNTTKHNKMLSCTTMTTLLDNLEENSRYEVNVSTVSQSVDGGQPRESGSVTDPDGGWTLPGKVDAPIIQGQDSRWVNVSWTSVKNPENVGLYVLRVHSDGACVQQMLLTVAGSVVDVPDGCNMSCGTTTTGIYDASGHIVTNLTPYQKYMFDITVINPGGCGSTSASNTAITDQDIPGVVGVPAVTPSNVSMDVTWTQPLEPNGIITSYTIEWCPLNRMNNASLPGILRLDMCNNTHTTDTNGTNFEIDGLDAYTNYNVSVAAHTEVGIGDFVAIIAATTASSPFGPVSVSANVLTADSIEVNWELPGGAYPTGPVIIYDVTAAEELTTVLETAPGFGTATVVVDELEAHVNYTICVTAHTMDIHDNILISERRACTTARTEESASGAVGSLQVVEQPNICHQIKFRWTKPSTPNGKILRYEITVQNTKDPKDLQTKNVSADEYEYVAKDVDPNNAEYNIAVVPINGAGKGQTNSTTERTGKCYPTAIAPETTFPTNPGTKSRTTFDVAIDHCSLCVNTNGDINFTGLIITENLDFAGNDLMYADVEAMNKVFGPWNSYNKTVGYRTTPDKWIETVNCNSSSSICKQNAISGRRKRQTEPAPYVYRVGGGDCGDPYCNHALGDSKDTRKFKVRLVIQTPGGVLVMKFSKEVYELKPNNDWIAAPVVICILFVVLLILGVIYMQRKKMGPFKDKYKHSQPIGATELGQHNPGFTTVEEPLIDRPSPVYIDNFEQHVLERAKDSDLLFAEEYKLIQELSPQHPATQSEHPNNRLKNRFVNILPFDHSRVKLLPADDDESSDYINANYMPGYNSKREFIASQGPMKSTVDDFWRMIWEQDVPLIVMVTQLEERGRERCAKYWPNDHEPMYYGDLQVQMRSESVLDSYVIRILDVRLGEATRSITQMHFIRWPDFGVPEKPEMLLEFVESVRIHLPRVYNGAILIHCSAGVGRTGSFIAIDRLLLHIREQQTIDVFSVVLEMRNYRSYMIQVEAQYILIHKCISAALKKGLHRQRPASQAIPDDPIYANTAFEPEEAIYENAMTSS